MWIWLAGLRILVADIILAFFIKKTAGRKSRSRRLVIQYALILVLSLCACLLIGAPFGSTHYDGTITLFGLLNALTCYVQWRAIDMSQSRFAVLNQLSVVPTLALGVPLFGEYLFLTPLVIAGVLCSSLGAVLFVVPRKKVHLKIPPIFYFWMALSIILTAIQAVLMKYFAADREVSRWTFMLLYYLGSSAAAGLIMALGGSEERGERLGMSGWQEMSPLALCIYGARVLNYWLFELAPLLIVVPLLQITGVFFPFLIGAFVFKERSTLSRTDYLASAIATTGILCLVVSF